MSAAYPLRWCVRARRGFFATSRNAAPPPISSIAASRCPSRQLSSTPTRAARRRDDDDDANEYANKTKVYDDGKPIYYKVDEMFDKAGSGTTVEPSPRKAGIMESKLGRLSTNFGSMARPPALLTGKKAVYNRNEPDPDYVIPENTILGEFEGDDILAPAHAKLEEHREYREYARLAIWDMPLLSKLAKPFEPPTQAQPLRWRYTTYMGEFHPAEKKVVVEFSPRDFGLTDVEMNKLRKLAGARWNPEKDTIKMSSENYEHAAQNKRYLGDLVNKLIAEAKETADTFEDIPLDTRHHPIKIKPKFPKEWRMTEDRRAQLSEMRHQAYKLDEAKRTDGSLVDGMKLIQKALAAPEEELRDRVAEMMAAS